MMKLRSITPALFVMCALTPFLTTAQVYQYFPPPGYNCSAGPPAQIPFATTSNKLLCNSLLSWDNTNDILNIGASTTPGTFSVGTLDTMVVNGVSVPIPGFAINSNIQGVIENHSYQSGPGTGGSRYYGVRSRGTIASPTIVATGDHLTNWYAAGYNGTNYSLGGYIRFLVDGTPGATAMPSDLDFAVSAAGSQTPTSRMTLMNDGSIAISGSVGVAGNVLTSGGPGVAASWSAGGGGSPASPTNSVQFNNAGAFGGDAGFTYVGSTTQTITLGTATVGPTIASTTGSGTGTTFAITASQGATNSSGGAFNITAGAGGATSGNGGAITVKGGGVTSGTGGAASLIGGASSGANTGATAAVTGGAGGATGAGGNVNITTGAGGGTSGSAGTLALASGTTTSGTGGAITVTAGTGGAASVGGGITVAAGPGGSGAGGTGGGLSLASGAATGANNAGTVTITGGAPSATAGSTGGAVNISAGAGSSTTTGAQGNSIQITAGNAGGSGANVGGNVTIRGGNATGANNGGQVNLIGGNVGTGITNGYQNIAITAGSSGSVMSPSTGANADTASIAIIGSASSAVANNGSDVLIRGGAPGGNAGTVGGNVWLRAGGGALANSVGNINMGGYNTGTGQPNQWYTFNMLTGALGVNGATYGTSGQLLMSQGSASPPTWTSTITVPTSFAGTLSGGTKFTTSGCSVSSTTGGAAAGVFTLGANTCTVVITMNGATGATATNGWSCQAHDRTAPTVLIGGESSSTTTTASITIPAGAGATDVISFSCTGY